MKKFVLTLLGSVLIGTSVNAQEAKCGSCKKQDKAQHKTEMMAQKLGLDEAQKAKVLELNKNFELKLQSASTLRRKIAVARASIRMKAVARKMRRSKVAAATRKTSRRKTVAAIRR